MNPSTTFPVNQGSFAGLIGVAREAITPPAGIYSRSWGAASADTAAGFHRTLTLTCLTFQIAANTEPLVLMAADLGWWKSLDDERTVRNEILGALGLAPARLMICLSHTHAGPSLGRNDASKPGGEFIEPYLRQLTDAAIRVARSAQNSARQAGLAWRFGKCDLATNRDLPEADSHRYLVGFNPAEEADDTLLLGRVTDESGRIMATLVNYACHPTTLAWQNRLISPDYIGGMREVVEKTSGAPCLFLQGASGELAPAEQYTGDVQIAEAHGRRLGYAALATLESMLPAGQQIHFSGAVESGAPLAVWERSPCAMSNRISAELIDVALPLKPMPTHREIEAQWEACEDRILKERLSRQRAVRKNVGDGDTARLPLWIWRLGDALLVGHPNEAYSEFQRELRRQITPGTIAVMNIVNGYVGYLPPARLCGENIYPVWQTPFASGALEELTRAAVAAGRRLMTES